MSSFFKKNNRTRRRKKAKKENHFLSIFFAILLAFAFRSFVLEPFNIPSGSMKANLLVGDYIFVKKFSYGYSRYSFPFGFNFFEGRIPDSMPERGDVAVFRLPTDPDINYVKRIIGLPGDKIQVKEGVLFVNDNEAVQEKIEDFYDEEADVKIAQYIETLPSGKSYKILDEKQNYLLDNTPVYTVPEKHYFAMGDNRDNSQDSRVLQAVGYIPQENLIGEVSFVFFSSRSNLWKFWDYRADRFFKFI